MNGFFNAGDWLVVLVYLGAIVALGLWSGRRQRDTRDYFLGSRNVPWWGVGLSIVAAETSALTVIGVPSIAYGGNLMFLQMIVGYVIARLILAAVMVPHYLNGEIYSPYQLLETHLGRGPRRLAGGLFLLLETTAAGVRVYVACIPVRLMLGDRVAGLGGMVDPILGAILLFVGLALLYTVAGGVKAVIWTDAAQFGLFVAGGLFTLAYISLRLPDGWSGAMTQAAAAGKLAWLNTSFSWSAPFNLWMGLLGGTALVLSTHGAEQLIVQRVLSCGKVSEGRKALVLSAVLIFPLFLIFLLAGVLLWVFYQSHPFQIPLPESRPGLKSTDFIYPIFIVSEAPHLLKGFLLVAILAAAMSSISSALTALASVSTMDFLHPALPGKSDAFFLRLSRWSTIGWAVTLVGVAWLSRHVEFVLNAAFSLRGLTSGALLGGLIAALFLRRLGARAVMAGMLVSLVVMNTLYWPPNLPATRAWWLATFGGEVFWPWFTLIGLLVTLGTAAAVRALWPERKVN
jgi:solute:Na+ symporter, SSS family